MSPVSCTTEPARLALVGEAAKIRHVKRAWNAVSQIGWLPVLAGIAGVLVVLWLVVVTAPPWFVQHRSPEMAKTENEVRTTLLQGLAGVVLVLGAYFTYRQVMLGRAQLQIAQEGQITERFTRAIDQLGHDQLDVRIGGIYALERIARDSPTDRATIGEVLTAFVRSHAPWPPRLPGQYVAAAPIDEVPDFGGEGRGRPREPEGTGPWPLRAARGGPEPTRPTRGRSAAREPLGGTR